MALNSMVGPIDDSHIKLNIKLMEKFVLLSLLKTSTKL